MSGNRLLKMDAQSYTSGSERLLFRSINPVQCRANQVLDNVGLLDLARTPEINYKARTSITLLFE